MKKIDYKRIGIDILFDIIGSLLLAIGIYSFSQPANIAPGGVSGISLMLNYLWNFPLGLSNFILNIPLLILAWKYMGKSFTLKTLRTIVISTILLDFVVVKYIPTFSGDRLMSSLFSGVFMGAGLALVFIRGSTTGGVDIVSYLLQLRFPHMQIGRALLLVDCVILVASIIVFKDIESALFGLVSLYVQTKIIDGVLYGLDKGSMITVISKHNEKIADRILNELDRGATLLQGYGAYSKAEMKVLLCVVRRAQFTPVKNIVHQVDPNAFLVVHEVGEIWGEGFKEVEQIKSDNKI